MSTPSIPIPSFEDSPPSSPEPGLSAPPSPPNRAPIPSLRSFPDFETKPTSAPLGPINSARRPSPPSNSNGQTHTPFASMTSLKSGGLPKDVQARLQAFQASRKNPPGMPNGSPPLMPGAIPPAGPIMNPGGMSPRSMGRPMPSQNWSSASAIARMGPGAPKPSLGQRRGLKLAGGLPGSPASTPGGQSDGSCPPSVVGGPQGSLFNKYAEFVDTTTGSLKFAGKAVIHSKGVDFSSGSSFSISLQEVDIVEELGKGNYGTVYKVVHRKPSIRRGGGISIPSQTPSTASSSAGSSPDDSERPMVAQTQCIGTNVEMAMKEIRLELDENKFAQIIMELDVLHRCLSPYIIDFYGAFFQEGAVYICMEYMDGGSIDKLYRDGVPEGVLRKITYATVMGLKTLKDEHNIIHRDVKPTNILVSSRGDIKLCDFGVSGNLVASIAKTNIGCQSYMAPERIASGGVQAAVGGSAPGTYGVQSDIWSLGLSILECAMGCYPYPPETYNNIFSQLSAIVDGEPPDLPADGFTLQARDFVSGCLNKIPNLRPTYAMLLRHPWLATLAQPATIPEDSEQVKEFHFKGDQEVRDWVMGALEKRSSRLADGGKGPESEKPALHAAPLTVMAHKVDIEKVTVGIKEVSV
ncbi:MAP kinase kinase Wis1 [Rhizina undulata]